MRRAALRNSRSAPPEVSSKRSAVPVDAICEGRERERVRGRRPKSGWRDESGVNDYARTSTERGGATHQRVRVRVLGVARNHRIGV